MSRFGGYEDRAFLAELYDLVPGYAHRQDVQFYVDQASAAGGPALELGCGTGRVLIPIARAGPAITGLDLSPYMLAKCAEKLAAEPQGVRRRVTLLRGSMTDFDLGQTFALAIIPFRPFQHLITAEEQLACLHCINRHLPVGGKLVFDLFHPNLDRLANPCLGEEREDTPEFALPDGRRLRRTNRFVATHRAEQYNEVEMIFYLTGTDGVTQRLVQAFPFRYLFRYETEHLLARSGFRVVSLYGDFDRSPLADASPEMIYVAEKVE